MYTTSPISVMSYRPVELTGNASKHDLSLYMGHLSNTCASGKTVSQDAQAWEILIKVVF